MRYLPKSPGDRVAMLAEIGVDSIDDLFSTIPAEYQLKRDLKVPRQHGESEIIERFRGYAENNATGYASFLGAGVYKHYKPVINLLHRIASFSLCTLASLLPHLKCHRNDRRCGDY